MTVLAGPVIGEFGYAVFMTAPHVNAWLTQFPDHERLVACPHDWGELFPLATLTISIPHELIPQPGLGTSYYISPRKRRGRHDHGHKYPPKLLNWFNALAPPDAKRFSPPHIVDLPKGEPPYHSQHKWGVEPKYIKYQGPPLVQQKSIVIAARRRLEFGPIKNWPPPLWDELCGDLQERFPGRKLLSIGSPKGSYFPRFTDPYPGLHNAIRALSNAACSISSNSGVTHLSLMCGCPTFSWGENRKDLPYLMRTQSNPLDTPGEYHPVGWRPPKHWVLKEAGRFINGA